MCESTASVFIGRMISKDNKMLCQFNLHDWEEMGYVVAQPTLMRLICKRCEKEKDVPRKFDE